MVSGLEFLRMVCPPVAPQRFKFDPFGDEDPFLNNLGFNSVLDFLELGDNPRPAPKPEAELYHPVPVHVQAHVDAIERFEEMAQSMDCSQLASKGGHATNPWSNNLTAIPRRFNPFALSPDEQSKLPVSQRVIGPPKRGSGQQPTPLSPGRAGLSTGFLNPFPDHKASKEALPHAPRPEKLTTPTFDLVKARAQGYRCFHPPSPAPAPPQPDPAAERASGGLACISPGFLDNFPEYAKRQSAWGRAPRPEDLPRPTFVLTRAPVRKDTPVPNPVPAIPPQDTGSTRVEENSVEEEQKFNEADYDSASSISSFFDEERVIVEVDDGQSSSSMSDERSCVAEDDDEFYTASEYSGYEADDDSFGDVKASVSPKSAHASPDPILPSPSSSTDSLVYTTTTSPATSLLLTDSGAPTAQAALHAVNTNESHLGLQLRWSAGMPGDAVKFLVAAERALQKASRVQT